MTVIDTRMNYGVVPGGLVIDADDCDSDVTSSIVDMRGLVSSLSVHITLATNTDSVGVIYIRMSNFAETTDGVDVTWGNPAVSSITVSSGSDVNEFIDLQVYGRYLWVFYDRTSGGGQADCALSCVVETKRNR